MTNTQKLGRNDLCHCSSGKKYKKCCLRKDEELEPVQTEDFYGELEELETTSNSIPDLMDAGKLKEAEAAAKYLLEKFPDQIDGFAHLGAIYMEKKDFSQAADYYRKAVQFATSNNGCDEETIEHFEEMEEEARSLC